MFDPSSGHPIGAGDPDKELPPPPYSSAAVKKLSMTAVVVKSNSEQSS